MNAGGGNPNVEPLGAGNARRPSLLAIAGIFCVRGYQRVCRPWMGNICRFHPSCSDYYILAVRKYGFWRGSLRGCWRILRCHPLHPGGVDDP